MICGSRRPFALPEFIGTGGTDRGAREVVTQRFIVASIADDSLGAFAVTRPATATTAAAAPPSRATLTRSVVTLVRSARRLGAVIERRFEAPFPAAIRSGAGLGDAVRTMAPLVVIPPGTVEHAGAEAGLVG